MKLKRLFALALIVCMALAVAPVALASGILSAQEQTPMVYNTRATSRATPPLRSDELAAIEPPEYDHDKLRIDKKVDTAFIPNEENTPYYKIDLNAKAISNIVVETKATAIDVILILDRSSNMAAENRMSSLITAINGDPENNTKGFLDTVKETAADSRVAVVSYADAGESTIDSAGGTTTDAFVKLSNKTAYDSLRSTISGLNDRIGGDAYSDEAFEKAARIFQAVPKSDENYANPRIVIFFTAGIPGDYGKSAGWEYHTGSGRSAVYPAYNVAQESIHWSVILKSGKTDRVNLDLTQEFWTWGGTWAKGNSQTPESAFIDSNKIDARSTGCGATVYCVGLELDGCTDTRNGEKHAYNTTCPGTRTNEYLYRISSHRPDGSHVEGNKRYNEWEATRYQQDWGSSYKDDYTRNLKKSFASAPASYYQVGEIDEISGMFNEIKVDVEQNKPITDVVMRDYLAPGFVPCDSKGTVLSVGQTITTDGYVGTVKQDGDVYYIEWAATTLEPGEDGKDEINASIYVKPVDNLGGQNIQTNIYGPSGLYSDGTLFASFPVCQTDIPVKEIIPAVQHQTIYLSNTADLLKLRGSIDSKLNGKNNAGVVVTYELKAGEDPIATYEIAKGATTGVWKNAAKEEITTLPAALTDCVTYTLTCTVNGGGTNTVTSDPVPATVHVRKPDVAAGETTTYIGNSVTLPVGTVESWTDADEPADAHVQGTVPTNLAWHYYNGQTQLGVSGISFTASDDVCDTLTAVLSIHDGTTYQAYDNKYNDTYTVHVLTPVLKAKEEPVIYLSKTVNLNEQLMVDTWNDCADGRKKTDIPLETEAPAPNSCTFTVDNTAVNDPDKYTNTECKSLNATWVLGTKTYSTDFTVHVLKPTVYTKGTTIYLGNTASLTGYVGDTWSCAAPCTAGKTKTTTTDNPPKSADFTWDFVKETNTDDSIIDVQLSGCTDVLAVGTLADQPFTSAEAVKVHVVKPIITTKDIAMYYGNSLELHEAITDNEDWICDHTFLDADNAPAIDYTYGIGTDGTVAAYTVETCNKAVTVSAKVKDIAAKVDGKNDSAFALHVLKPVVTFQDSTIYWSKSPVYTNNFVSEDWDDCKDDILKNVTTVGEKPELTYGYTPDDNTFSNCTDVNVTVKINDKAIDEHVTFKVQGTSSKADGKEFTVHVVKPVIEYHDKTIYLGDAVVFAEQVSEADAWICGHNASLDVKNAADEQRIAPVVEYNYTGGNTAPADCVLITVAANIKDTTIAVPAKDADTGFDIHVLKPKFEVVAGDRWADYDQVNALTLTDFVATTTKAKTAWADTHTDHKKIPAVDKNAEPGVPSDFTYTIRNEQNIAVTTHLVGVNDTDFTVELTGFKIGSTPYDSSNWSDVTYDGDAQNTNAAFTIHVNKFDLTIEKTWKDGEKDADNTYKQDAIFNLYQVVTNAETEASVNNLITQVVLPAKDADGKIVIKDLLCGQNYKVEEQTDWTWRWKVNVVGDQETIIVDSEDCGSHEVSVSNPHDNTTNHSKPTAHGEKATEFVNTLFNRLWLSFCTFVENVFAALVSQKGGSF